MKLNFKQFRKKKNVKAQHKFTNEIKSSDTDLMWFCIVMENIT